MNWLAPLSSVLSFRTLLTTLLIGGSSLTAYALLVDEYKSGIVYPEPKLIDPGTATTPPEDATVLFDGKSLAAWDGGEKWQIADGIATAAGGGISTKEKFGDCQLHVEFATPAEVRGNGQGRGNSGVYLMGHYELQVLDSHNNPTYFDGQCGSIYKQQPPMINASRKPGEWQSYDILFTAPRFNDDGTVKTAAYITVLQNGLVIHNHYEIQGTTSYTEPPKYHRHGDKESLQLQFHGDAVRYRNLWIRTTNIHPLEGKKPEPK